MCNISSHLDNYRLPFINDDMINNPHCLINTNIQQASKFPSTLNSVSVNEYLCFKLYR